MRTRIRTISLIALLLSFIFSSRSRAQDEQWLQYRSAGQARQILGDACALNIVPAARRPEGVKLPAFQCDQPLFVLWETPLAASGKLWLAFDRSTADGQYDRLYLDANANGDLSDESAQEPARRETSRCFFGPARVVFPSADGPITYHLEIEFSSGNRTDCLLAPAGWYEGPVTIGGIRKHCVLIDHNVNGAFNDKSLDSSRSDRIRLGSEEGKDLLFVGNYIEVEDKLYGLEVARDGAFVVLKEAADVPHGTVRVAGNITTLSVGGENGSFVRALEKGVMKVPAGAYRIDYWGLTRKDDAGSTWQLTAGRPPGEDGGFAVTQDQETQLSIGELPRAKISVTGSGSNHVFGYSLEGRQGEQITVLCNGARPRPPKLRIRSKDGTFDRTLSFEYG